MPVIGNDCDAAAKDAAASERRIRDRELDGRDHAWHLADRVEVVALHSAAIDRAGLHGCPFHAGNAHVDAVDNLARHFVRNVEVLPLSSHQCPLVGRLDRDLLRIRMRRSRRALRDLSISRRAPALRMRDDAIFRSQFGHRHGPETRGSRQQSLSSLGSGKLQIVPAILNR